MRPSARGKFLFVGGRKLYVRGTTYGTFRPGPGGKPYPASSVVARDFADMRANGFNAVRTYTVPPRWLLDLAAEHDLLVLVGIAWEQHIDFLEQRGRAKSIESCVRAGVSACAGHPTILGYSVGNEIPGQIVRWLGRERVEGHIARLCRAAKSEDPEGLVTYVNYPPTEYLQLPFLDFSSFNVYLESRVALDAYLARLQNITGDRPLLMAEIGLDSRTHGELGQAAILDWQIRTAFSSGCAGAFVFAWTDDWYVRYLSEMAEVDGEQVDDWDFGLTRRDRRPKPALQSVRVAFADSPFHPATSWPRVSVVVCTHNGAETLCACLRGLRELDYPNFEVIVVDDGSTDSSPAIARQFGFQLIRLERGGLSTARNVGMRAASGEIVAYIDDDAEPDREWLKYLTASLARSEYAGMGGPNLPPDDCARVARCVADAPGSPMHVLTSDREAEHIPGCNMAFYKDVLEQVGGFDPQFRAAGDDVDLCWRLLQAGHKLGFSPAAVVWHRPRGSIRAYWRQQRGYGRAEGLLERKWSDKYGAGGRARWAGRLYGRGLLPSLGRWRVYYGTWGAELFQSLYAPARASLSSPLATPDWYLWITALALISIAGVWWSPLLLALPVLLLAVAITLGLAGVSAAGSRCVAEPRRWRARAVNWVLMTLLHVIQPVARLSGRIASRDVVRSGSRRFSFPRPRDIKRWTETWQSSASRLAALESQLRSSGVIVARGGAYDRWDLEVRRSFIGAVRVRMGIEEHGAGRQLVRVHLTPRYSRAAPSLVALLFALSLIALLDGAHPAAALPAVAGLVAASLAVRSVGLTTGSVLRALRPDESAERRELRQLELERA
jgi:GT2 family glycosyltransferase